MQRRLSAILAADVVGYSRLMGKDEVGTLNRLKALRFGLVEPAINSLGGRVVKVMGDGLLAEFASVVQAVQCALDIQKAVLEQEAGVPEESRILLRIGVNSGDIIGEGADIYGDGVNVAARLESLAGPGEVFISGNVHTEVVDRLKVPFKHLGPQKLKNISRPITVWRWAQDDGPSMRAVPEQAAGPASGVELVHRPAVLFLPFEALSHSDEDKLLASGLCEDIRTTLSCWRSFPVVGPEALGGSKGDIQHLAASVEAAYAVTGSVRRAGTRARVTARLIEAASGRELWSQTFDGSLEDVFGFQDEISRQIVSQVEPEISQAAAGRIPVVRPKDLATWELLAKAVQVEMSGGDGYGSREANEQQQLLVREAIAHDPLLSEAWARLARCYFRDFLLGWAGDTREALAKGLDASARAVELDPRNSIAHSSRSQLVLFGKHNPEGGFEHAREAVRLNPSNVMGHYMMGCALVYCGEPARAYDHYAAVLRLNPAFPNKGALYCDQMMCQALVGNLGEAVQFAHRTMDAAPNYLRGLQRCVSVLAHAGKVEEAKAVLLRIEEMGCAFSEAYVRETYPFRRPEDFDFLIDGLRLAGWTG
ncbi:adenylate/guanylate cyclase domain-containing protein [Roseibium sp.]|uniref:adenylate/guanylate cyclase domain-containing protein n=1 Tax=Roseibium sp. TaxID=1936156 RepID=UPI003D0B3B11